jgi:hypothetical protein
MDKATLLLWLHSVEAASSDMPTADEPLMAYTLAPATIRPWAWPPALTAPTDIGDPESAIRRVHGATPQMRNMVRRFQMRQHGEPNVTFPSGSSAAQIRQDMEHYLEHYYIYITHASTFLFGLAYRIGVIVLGIQVGKCS